MVSECMKQQPMCATNQHTLNQNCEKYYTHVHVHVQCKFVNFTNILWQNMVHMYIVHVHVHHISLSLNCYMYMYSVHVALKAVRSVGSCGSLISSCTCIYMYNLHVYTCTGVYIAWVKKVNTSSLPPFTLLYPTCTYTCTCKSDVNVG